MPSYEAYLLRIWWSTPHERGWWRCRLERLPGGEQQQFAELEALLAYLRTRARADDSTPAALLPRGTPCSTTDD